MPLAVGVVHIKELYSDRAPGMRWEVVCSEEAPGGRSLRSTLALRMGMLPSGNVHFSSWNYFDV